MNVYTDPWLIAVNERIMADRAAGEKPQVPKRLEVPPCGTFARYRRHLKACEPVGDECRAAGEAMRLQTASSRKGGQVSARRVAQPVAVARGRRDALEVATRRPGDGRRRDGEAG